MLDGLRDIAKRYGDTISAAWADRHRNPVPTRRREEAAFLPAMLEIQETPPHPLARVTMWLILALFASAVVWMVVGRIDIVATATGKILPDSHIKVVQAPHSGIVKSIFVKDGDRVSAGDVLVELDNTASHADYQNLHNELTASRLEAAMAGLLASLTVFDQPPPLQADGALADIAQPRLAAQQQTLDNLFHEQKSRQAQIDEEIETLKADLLIEKQGIANARAQLEQSRRSTQQRLQGKRYQIEKISALLPIAEDEYRAYQSLHEKSIVSRVQMQQAREKLLSLQKDQQYEMNQLEEIRAAGGAEQMRHEHEAEQFTHRYNALKVRIASKQQTRTVEKARFRREMNERHAAAQRRTRELKQQLVKSTQLEQLHQITAPVDGTVQQMQLHTNGAVVQAAQSLLVLVPLQRTLEVEAFVENKDIGFVNVGQPVEIKVDAFPYTKFGLLHGEVLHISADAVEDERRGLIYQARIRLHDSALVVAGKKKPLVPGMSVVAEIKTGHRRVIEFFLAPIIQHGRESLGER